MSSTAKKEAAWDEPRDAGSPYMVTPLCRGDMELDFFHHRLITGGRQITLTYCESTLMFILLQQFGALVGRETLYETAAFKSSRRALESIVSRLRKKLNGSGYTITAKRGRGYVLMREDRV